jgi:hypothetical protein
MSALREDAATGISNSSKARNSKDPRSRGAEMMRIRLNGWQRIGIIVSVLWLFGMGTAGYFAGVANGKSCGAPHPERFGPWTEFVPRTEVPTWRRAHSCRLAVCLRNHWHDLLGKEGVCS